MFDERGVWGGSGEEVGFETHGEGSPGRQIDCFWLRFTKEVAAIGFVVF